MCWIAGCVINLLVGTRAEFNWTELNSQWNWGLSSFNITNPYVLVNRSPFHLIPDQQHALISTIYWCIEWLSCIPGSKNIHLQWLFCVYPQAGQVAYWPPGPGHWADTPGLANSAWLGRHHQKLSHQSQPTRDLQLLTGTDAAETTKNATVPLIRLPLLWGWGFRRSRRERNIILCLSLPLLLHSLHTFFSPLCKSTKAKNIHFPPQTALTSDGN